MLALFFETETGRRASKCSLASQPPPPVTRAPTCSNGLLREPPGLRGPKPQNKGKAQGRNHEKAQEHRRRFSELSIHVTAGEVNKGPSPESDFAISGAPLTPHLIQIYTPTTQPPTPKPEQATMPSETRRPKQDCFDAVNGATASRLPGVSCRKTAVNSETNQNSNAHHPSPKPYKQRCGPRCDALNRTPSTQPMARRPPFPPGPLVAELT